MRIYLLLGWLEPPITCVKVFDLENWLSAVMGILVLKKLLITALLF
jgi:hypothetical protein